MLSHTAACHLSRNRNQFVCSAESIVSFFRIQAELLTLLPSVNQYLSYLAKVLLDCNLSSYT